MKEAIQLFTSKESLFQQAKYVRDGSRIAVGLPDEFYHEDLAKLLGISGEDADDHGFMFFNRRTQTVLINGSSGAYKVASPEARAETGSCVCGIVGDHLHVVANHPLKGEVFDSKKK